MSAAAEPLRGSCLCGAVAFALHTPLLSMSHCHCRMCRKQHGTAFSTYIEIAAAGLHWLRGAEQVQAYASSPGVERRFCSICGSKLVIATTDRLDHLWVAAGALDDAPPLAPQCHIFVGSKAPWYAIHDNLPQHEAYPEPAT